MGACRKSRRKEFCSKLAHLSRSRLSENNSLPLSLPSQTPSKWALDPISPSQHAVVTRPSSWRSGMFKNINMASPFVCRFWSLDPRFSSLITPQSLIFEWNMVWCLLLRNMRRLSQTWKQKRTSERSSNHVLKQRITNVQEINNDQDCQRNVSKVV